MAASNLNYVDSDSTNTSAFFYSNSDTLPDFRALNVAFNKLDKMLNNFFTIEDLPQISFYDTPHGAIFSGSGHKKVQIKRRILEYQAKY